jgi:TonB-dependent starch-binding outer membrane protein SusC
MSVSPRRAAIRALDLMVCTSILLSAACRHAQPTASPSTAVAPARADDARHRLAGVDIVRTPHSGFLIRIRSGMFAGGEPLYVIDGAQMRIPSNRGIDWFAPEDIVDIKVLKFPHELAEYGLNGANGVVVITTRQAAGRSRRR